MLYVKLVTSRSRSVDILGNGKYHQHHSRSCSAHLIKASSLPVFCLGDPEGIAVKVGSKRSSSMEHRNHSKEVRTSNSISRWLPSELNAQ